MDAAAITTEEADRRSRHRFDEAFRVWLRVAVLSFGGPAGQIAVMHRILVEEKRWISESRFLHALNYCMLLPGPEAQQLATYIGWLMHRTAGGLMAGGLFILPGIIAIMGLSYVYAAYGNVGFVEALFFGLKAAVLAIVVQAVVRVGKRALRNRRHAGAGGDRLHRDLLFQRPLPHHHHRGRHHRLHRCPERPAGVRCRRAWRRAAKRRRSTVCSAMQCRARPAQHGPRDPRRRVLAGAVAGAGRVAPDHPRSKPMCSARSRCSSPRWRW